MYMEVCGWGGRWCMPLLKAAFFFFLPSTGKCPVWWGKAKVVWCGKAWCVLEMCSPGVVEWTVCVCGVCSVCVAGVGQSSVWG